MTMRSESPATGLRETDQEHLKPLFARLNELLNIGARGRGRSVC